MNGTQREVSLAEAAVTYLAFLAVFIILVKLTIAVDWFPGIIAWAAYLAFGIYLNRVVLRGLIEWHHMFNYLENVSRAKLGFFFFWPFEYPILFFQIAVNKAL
jgi:hypothetical protein